MLAAHLAPGGKALRLGEKHVGQQMEIITLLEKHQHNASGAWALLRLFEELQQFHVAHRPVCFESFNQLMGVWFRISDVLRHRRNCPE